jgi:hypothetical protein
MRFWLNFVATYDITEQIEISFDVRNITHAHLEFIQTKSKGAPLENAFYHHDRLAGVRVRL